MTSAPADRPVRWGIVGTGGISRQIVSDFALVENADVVAVVSRDHERAAVFADEFGITERYSDREAMFHSDIDAVYIGTPHATHFSIAAAAVRAGRHVLCEKPLGMNGREVGELSALASAAGVFLMEAMWMKFNPLYTRLSHLIADGILGEIRSVRASFGAAFPRDGSSRWQTGGSALLDQGIYPVTLAHMLLGRPETIQATGTVRADGVDLRESFTLGYPDARFAQCASSMMEWLDPSAAVSGTNAWVTIDGGFWWASRMTVHHPLPRGQRRDEVIEVEREGYGYVPMLRAVDEAIRGGALEHPLHTAAAASAVYATLDEIRRQIAPTEVSRAENDPSPGRTSPPPRVSPN